MLESSHHYQISVRDSFVIRPLQAHATDGIPPESKNDSVSKQHFADDLGPGSLRTERFLSGLPVSTLVGIRRSTPSEPSLRRLDVQQTNFPRTDSGPVRSLVYAGDSRLDRVYATGGNLSLAPLPEDFLESNRQQLHLFKLIGFNPSPEFPRLHSLLPPWVSLCRLFLL